MKEVEKYLNLSKDQLKQAEENLAKKKVDLASTANYVIKVSEVLVPQLSLLACLCSDYKYLYVSFFFGCNRASSPSVVTLFKAISCNFIEITEIRTFSNSVHFNTFI